MDIKEIKKRIADESISDEIIREELEKIDPLTTPSEQKKDILTFLQQKRPQLYRTWQGEVAASYM